MTTTSLSQFPFPRSDLPSRRARGLPSSPGCRAACVLSLVLAMLGARTEAAEQPDGTPSPAAPPASGSPSTEPAAPHARQAPLPGQLSGKFGINYWDPESSVPTARERDNNPLEFGYFLQDLLERADKARKENDHKAVIRFYRAVAKAVPDSAKGWSKLCEAYEIVNDRDRAIRACRYALDRPGAELQDYLRYVHLVLARPGELTAAETTDLNAVLGHMEKQGSLEFPVNQLRCELGVKLKDVTALEACTKALERLAPNDPRTVVFQWSLALQKGQRAEAERLIERATKAGVVLEHIERMQKVTAALRGGLDRRMLRLILAAGALLLVGAAVFFAIRRRALAE